MFRFVHLLCALSHFADDLSIRTKHHIGPTQQLRSSTSETYLPLPPAPGPPLPGDPLSKVKEDKWCVSRKLRNAAYEISHLMHSATLLDSPQIVLCYE